MANLSSGVQWGQFIRGVDPGRSLADTFLQGFKESIAYKLAEKKDKMEQQMKQQEMKAMGDWRNLQMMVKQAEMKQQQQRYDTLQKQWEKDWAASEPERKMKQMELEYAERREVAPWKVQTESPGLLAQRQSAAYVNQKRAELLELQKQILETEQELTELAKQSGGGGLGMPSLQQKQQPKTWWQTPFKQSYIGKSDAASKQISTLAQGLATADDARKTEIIAEITRIAMESNILKPDVDYNKKGELTNTGAGKLRALMGISE